MAMLYYYCLFIYFILNYYKLDRQSQRKGGRETEGTVRENLLDHLLKEEQRKQTREQHRDESNNLHRCKKQ